MSNFNDSLSNLLKHFSSENTSGKSIGRLLSATDLVSQGQAELSVTAEKLLSVSTSEERKPMSFSSRDTPEGIKFGSPSNPYSGSTSSSAFTTLLKQTASGGVASALGGGFGFGSIGGLGSLLTGIMSLFGSGSKKTLPPLVEFQLPSSQEQTVYVSSKGSTLYQGTAAQSETVATHSGGSGIYSNGEQLQTSASAHNVEWIQDQSTQIAQAVKNALLNSSSLNDVIADI